MSASTTPRAASVICCNDSVEHVVVGGTEEEVEAVLDRLRAEHYARVKDSFKATHHYKTGAVVRTQEEAYRQRCYWHVHEVWMTELKS